MPEKELHSGRAARDSLKKLSKDNKDSAPEDLYVCRNQQ